MKTVDVMEKVSQVGTFKDGMNVQILDRVVLYLLQYIHEPASKILQWLTMLVFSLQQLQCVDKTEN